MAAYEQIHDMIRRGELKSGDKLPSEHELSALLKVSRPTGTPLLLLSETMRRKDGQVALYTKGYFDPNYFSFLIQRT